MDHFLSNHANQSRRLSCYLSGWPLSAPVDGRTFLLSHFYPALEELSVDSAVLLPKLSQLPNLRSLHIPVYRGVSLGRKGPNSRSSLSPRPFRVVRPILMTSSHVYPLFHLFPSIHLRPPSLYLIEVPDRRATVGQIASRSSPLSTCRTPIRQLTISFHWLDLYSTEPAIRTFEHRRSHARLRKGYWICSPAAKASR